MNVAYIPVRGGSKSIPMKNIKEIAGKPLVWWAADAACKCSGIDAVYVSTDSDEISSVVQDFGFDKVRVIGRSSRSATDNASTETGLIEFANAYDFTAVALIQATSPFITAEDLSKGFTLINNNECDSVISVVRQKRFLWDDAPGRFASPVNYDINNRPRRQNFDGFLVENGAFYITKKDALLQTGCRLSGRIKTIEMTPESYIEIDEPEDWVVVEQLLKHRDNANKLAENIK